MKTPLFLISILSLMWGCSPQPKSETPVQSEHDSLMAIFQEASDFKTREDPLEASMKGIHEFDHLLPKVSVEDEERRAEFARSILKKLGAIDRSALNRQDDISLQLFTRITERTIKKTEFKGYFLEMNADSGFHINLAGIPKNLRLKSPEDYENYLKRLQAIPEYMNQNIALLLEAMKQGFVQPKVALLGYEKTISAHVTDDPEKSVFYQPFTNFPSTFTEEEKQRLEKEGREVVMSHAVAGYQTFLDFMVNTYLPNCRETLGASELPNGKAYYQHLIEHFTTLNLTEDDIHQIGLKEVARIRKEMDAIIEEVQFKGDFAAFLQFLRTDSQFYAKTGEELLMKAAWYAKSMDAKLPSLFKHLPRQPYGVAPVPDHLAPKYTGGRYVGASLEGTNPGYYWVNTYNLKSRPLYTQEALTLHEGVPGHHLQIALSKEMDDLPEFRRGYYSSAFGEGWGLYSEWLGLEAGFYTNPYNNFGRLTYEMWRACRLVVDTGIHAKGWTRQQSIDYLASNTALSIHECTTETDRYISWPGQALSYKMGEIKIKELRKKAEKDLGQQFDVREFHHAILKNGAVTLGILEQEVEAYIQEALSPEQANP